MEERRQLLIKIAKQLETMSRFVDGIEKSLYVMVQLDALEPQFRHAMSGLKQTYEALAKMHEESLVPIREKSQKEQTLKDNINHLESQNQKLKEEIELLKKSNQDTSKKRA